MRCKERKFGSRQILAAFEHLERRYLLAGDVGDTPLSCADAQTLTIPDTVISQTSGTRASGDIPSHCVVTVVIDDTIGVEVKLPVLDDWNEKFLMFGNRVFGGSIQDDGAEGLKRGYATAATDTGHRGGLMSASWALNDPQAEIDFGYRAVHLTAEVSKAIVSAFYANEIRYSYFIGASTGGRQGLMEAQRYPEDFEGIVAGEPGLNHTGLTAGFVWNQQPMFPDAGDLRNPMVPNSKIPALAKAARSKCDQVDGLEDGLITDPRDCSFVPAVDLPQCPLTGTVCFEPEEIEAIERVYAGPSSSMGQIYPGFMPGVEDGLSGLWGWNPMVTRATVATNILDGRPNWQYAVAEDTLRYLVYDDPDYDFRDFDFETDLADLAEAGEILNATDPDLTAFNARGGKLILWHGWGDYAIPPLETINYYEDVVESMSGLGNVQDFSRLFLLPGRTHVQQSPGPSVVDWLTALEMWVEQDTAPDALIATGGQPFRTRPVCAYPSRAEWDGQGDPDTADAFGCVDNTIRFAGDVNDDGAVNFSDFLVLSSNFGKVEAEWEHGDLDVDHEVQFADFLILAANFGNTRQQLLEVTTAKSEMSVDSLETALSKVRAATDALSPTLDESDLTTSEL